MQKDLRGEPFPSAIPLVSTKPGLERWSPARPAPLTATSLPPSRKVLKENAEEFSYGIAAGSHHAAKADAGTALPGGAALPAASGPARGARRGHRGRLPPRSLPPLPRVAGGRLVERAPLLSRSPPRQRIRFRSFVTTAVGQLSASLIACLPKKSQRLNYWCLVWTLARYCPIFTSIPLTNKKVTGREKRAVLNLLSWNHHWGFSSRICFCEYQSYVKARNEWEGPPLRQTSYCVFVFKCGFLGFFFNYNFPPQRCGRRWMCGGETAGR